MRRSLGSDGRFQNPIFSPYTSVFSSAPDYTYASDGYVPWRMLYIDPLLLVPYHFTNLYSLISLPTPRFANLQLGRPPLVQPSSRPRIWTMHGSALARKSGRWRMIWGVIGNLANIDARMSLSPFSGQIVVCTLPSAATESNGLAVVGNKKTGRVRSRRASTERAAVIRSVLVARIRIRSIPLPCPWGIEILCRQWPRL